MLVTFWSASISSAKPNVLFIAIDDLNDWIGCLGGHPQALTPNLDRLAASSVLFTNAHCPAPACNPSRSAIFTGISPHRSGLYRNGQSMRQVLPEAEQLPKTFSGQAIGLAGAREALLLGSEIALSVKASRSEIVLNLLLHICLLYPLF